MSMRLVRISMFALLLAFGGAFTALQAGAQDAEAAKQPVVYTYVAIFGVPRAQWGQYEKSQVAERKTFDGLLADGTIVAYGAATIEVHTGINEPTHVSWWSSTSVAGLMKTLEALRGIVASEEGIAFTMHADEITMSRNYNGKGGNAGGYILVQNWKVKPGNGGDFADLFTKYRKPDLDAAVASGAISHYSLEEDVIHTDAPGVMTLVLTFPDAESIDKFYAGIDEMRKKHPLFQEVFGGLTDPSQHRDLLLRVSYSKNK